MIYNSPFSQQIRVLQLCNHRRVNSQERYSQVLVPNDLPILDYQANQGGHLERRAHGAQLILHQQVDVNLRNEM
jgi:hypothetical protein